MTQRETGDANKPETLQIKVTWRLVWSLWWRWMVFSLIAGVIVGVLLVLFLYGPF